MANTATPQTSVGTASGGWARALIRRLLPVPVRGLAALQHLLASEAPELIEVPPGERVLVLAPHMDDEVIGCGGTLLKHAGRGCAITLAVLTDGSLGDPAAEARPMTPIERLAARRALTETRKRECRAAAEQLGVRQVRFYDFPDGGLARAAEAREAVREMVADLRPDLVYAPFLTDRQPDHRAAARLAAGLARRWPDLLIAGYEVWSPLHVTWMVDITEQAARKRQALECYASQLRHNDYRHTALGLNAYRTMFRGGRGFVEAFFAAPARAHAALALAMG